MQRYNSTFWKDIFYPYINLQNIMLMKKFLLSLAAAFCATAMYAEDVLTLPAVWGGATPADGAYSFNGSWAGAGTYLIGEGDTMYDASANDYVMMKYSNHEGGKFAFKVLYNKFVKEESWGKVYADDNLIIEDAAGTAFIKLDKTSTADGGKTYAEEIREIQIQDQGAATTFTIEKLAFITKAEYDALNAGPVENKALVLTLAEAKPNAWDNQVVINFPKPLEAGKKYTITMDVKGSVALEPKQGQYGPEAIQPVAQDANSANKDQWGGPADLQYLNHFTATTEWVNGVKDCDGNPIGTDGNFPYSRLMLNLGNYAGELSIDNVRAIDEAGEEYFHITFDTAEEQELVENCWMNVPKSFKVSDQPSGIEEVAADAEEAAYDLLGQPVKEAKGFMVKGGKTVYVK